MSDERLLIDSDYFEGLAFGVFENASGVDSGRSALLEAYNAYTWTDPEKAKQTLEYYGQALKFRDQDQSTFGEDVEKLAPVKMSDVTSMPGIETVQDAYTKWEELNNEYLNSESLEPTYVVAKQQFLNDIKTHAAAKRREANTEDSGVVGALTDTSARFLRGVAAGVEPIINSAVNIFTDGYELNDHLTELTNPEKDGKFIYELAGAAGNVAGFVGAGALAGGAGVLGFSLTQAGDKVVERYQDTMQLTGDPGKAKKATAYEAASQTLQTVGEKLVFGRVASTIMGKPTGTIGNDVVRAAGLEAISEGGGQVISNVAENIQTARPEGENLSRGVGLSMALGAAAGGVATAGAHYFPSKNNTDTRAEEIRETGEPITPVTKQVVGDIPQNVDVFVNEDVANLTAPAVVEEVTPSFESEDGTAYVETEPGKFTEIGTLPFDDTVFLSETDAKKVATAITSGENVVNTDQGVAIQHTDTEGNLTVEVIEASKTPSVGAFPLNISNPRSPNVDTKILPIKLGKRIREVSASQSIGAAGPAKTLNEVESEYSRKIRTSSSVGFMRKVGDEGIFYRPQKSSDVDTEVVIPIVLRNGVDKLVEIMSKPDTAPELKARMRVQLHNMYTTAGLKAAAEGNTQLAAAIEAEYRSRAQLISDIGTSGGRTLAFNKGKIDIDVLTRPVRAGDLAYKDALIAAGKEEGVDPLEIANSTTVVEEITEKIDAINKETTEDAPKEKIESNKKKIKKLEAERKKAEKLAAKKKAAEAKQAEAIRNESLNQLRIVELEKVLEDTNLSNTERSTIEAEVTARRGTEETDLVKRSDFARMWTSNLIGAPVGIAVGNLSGALEPVVATFGMSPDALRIFYKNVSAGELKYKTPLMEYYKGLFNSTAWKRGYKAAMIALTTGDRVKATLTPKELAAGRDLLNASSTIEYSQVIGDWVKATKDMKFGDSLPNNLLTVAYKASGIMSGSFLRIMTALEAQMSAVHDSSYDRATAAYYYNKALDEGVSDAELAEYMYSPEKNWARAQAETAYKAEQLKSAGIPMTPEQQHLSSIERYLTYRPKQVEISTWKKANSVGLNAPAPGYIGYIAHAIETNLKSMEGIPALNKVKYLVPFTNSIAQLMGRAVDMTPFAFVGATMGKDFTNRTDFERMTMIGAAITSTAAMTALAMYGLKQLELPEDERLFDIIGNYSSDKKKRDVFTGNGGLLYSVKIGNAYIPFGETPFVLMLGGVASVLDRVRDGKEPSPETATEMMYSGSVMLMNTVKGLSSLSMLRGVSELMSSFSDAAKGEPDADIRVARTLLNTFKGFIPGATIWRTISRYTDNPVDAKKDILSAIVEGIPGLQSMFGEPALNIFGEPMKKRHEEVYSMHRLFSTRGGDVDMRWLSDNGYTTPILSNLRFSDKIQAYAAKGDENGAKALDYQFKRKVYKAASADLRDLVGKYRQAYSYSAYSPRVQEQLNSDWNKILAKYAAKTVTE